jgi:hypothetical protein
MHRAQAKERRSTAHPSIYSDMVLLPDQTRPFICTSSCAGASRARVGGLTTRFLRGALLLSLSLAAGSAFASLGFSAPTPGQAVHTVTFDHY